MARVKINCPRKPVFSTEIPVLIGHINYGGHLGNDAILSIAHEARVRFLQWIGCSELDAFGTGLIMTDAAIVYKGEGFQGDKLTVSVVAFDISSRGFDLYYHISCKREDTEKTIAEIKTGMLCFDYDKRRPAKVPEKLREILVK